MSNVRSHSNGFEAKRRFESEDVAFALAWEIFAPGLEGWTVQRGEDDDGSEYLLVDPPLVYGEGFEVRPDVLGASITWRKGVCRAASVRDAMLTICPLSPDALKAAELLAAAPTPELQLG